MHHDSRTSLSTLALFLITLLLGTCLVATPAFAADPEEIDPDPETPLTADSGTVKTIVVDDPADLETARLAPGRYTIVLVDADGAIVEVYDIVVGS